LNKACVEVAQGIVFGADSVECREEESSFDKGFYISFPFDMFSLTSSRSRRTFSFRPTTRDGGQRVGTSYRLYGLVKDYRARNLEADWDQVFE
jgi:hypothetical protein